MKAERRHELKTNTLATKLVTVPDVGRKYMGPLVVGAALVVVVGFVIYRRMGASTEARNDAMMRLAEARAMVSQIRRPPSLSSSPLDSTLMLRIRSNFENGKGFLADVAGETDDARLLAQAALIRGDLNLALYQVPTPPGATTNPALRPAEKATPESLLADAAAAYQDVVEHYADQPIALASAWFGLATIAENRLDFTKAADLYQKIVKTDALPQALKTLAQERLETVKKIQSPAVISTSDSTYVKPTTGASVSATAPTTTGAATGSSTGPSLEPSTGPSTRAAALTSGTPATTMGLVPTTSPASSPSTPAATNPAR